MSGPKRNPDRINTIGVVVVGICGAVLVYVSIVALEAFYVNDTSEIQTMADYGGNDTAAKSLRTDQLNRVGEYGTNALAKAKPNEPEPPQTYRIPVEEAMKLVVAGSKVDPADLVPSLGRSEKATVLPIFGRPKPLQAPPAPPAGEPPAGAGSAAPVAPPAAPMSPTGAGTQPSPVNGAGPLDKAATPGTPGAPKGTDKPPKGANAANSANNPKPAAAKGPSTPGAGSATIPAKGSATPKGNGK